jgi:ribosomal protein S18 acetylase RimI-like enzyme
VERARLAKADDLERIVALACVLRDELVSMRGGALWSVREARPAPYGEQFGALLDRDDTCVVVGTIDDYVVGFGVVTVERLRDGTLLGRITELFVEEGARGVGVGEAIAVELIAFCDAHDCVGIDALALPGHRAAKNFFERSGFTARAIVMHRPHGGRE